MIFEDWSMLSRSTITVNRLKEFVLPDKETAVMEGNGGCYVGNVKGCANVLDC